jgi:hypothetical protein
LIHNYGVENTPHMQLPSGWDTARPSESDAGKKKWGPTNKDIMLEVWKNNELIQQVIREIRGLKEIMINTSKDSTPPPTPSSPKKETWSYGMGTPLGLCQAWGRCPGIVSPTLSLLLSFLVRSSVCLCLVE